MMKDFPLVVVRLRNKYDVCIAASDDKTSVAPICASVAGFGGVESFPKNTEWRLEMRSITQQYTEYSLRSIHDTELATTQSRGSGTTVVCQQKPNPTQPFLWRTYHYNKPPEDGDYLYCTSRTGGFYKLCAAPFGCVTVIPGNCGTQLDPGLSWFIEYVATSDSEVARTDAALQQQKQNILQHGYSISPSLTHPPPYNSPELTNSASGIHNGQPQYPPAQWTAAFATPGDGQTSNGTYATPLAAQQQGAFVSPHKYPGFGALPNNMQQMQPNNRAFFGAGSPFSTFINTGHNTNGSGYQTNAGNITIKNKGPIYKRF